MNESFIPRLNAFSEKLKEVSGYHEDQLIALTKGLQLIRSQHAQLTNNKRPIPQRAAVSPQWQEFIKASQEFERSAQAYHHLLQQHIRDTNVELGLFGNHWGGYIETKGVEFLLNWLRSECGVQLSFQKYKRWWGESKNLEIDLLAISETHLYVAEVKNQLKSAHFGQMQKNLETLKEKAPQYAHLIVQPIFVCLHLGTAVLNNKLLPDAWIVRYKGFDPDGVESEFEWAKRPEADKA